MIEWSLVLSVVVAVAILFALGVAIFLLTRLVELAAGCVMTIIGLCFVIAVWIDALNGWPISRRVAWALLSLASLLYEASLAAIEPVPALPHPSIP